MPSDEPYKPDPSILDYCPAEDVAEYPIYDTKLPDNWCHITPEGSCARDPKLSKEELSFDAQGGVRCITATGFVGVSGTNLDDSQKYACVVEDVVRWNEYTKLKCSWLTATKVGDREVRISVEKNETGKERKYYVSVGALYCWSKVLITQSAE
jgi:hypothetical protein